MTSAVFSEGQASPFPSPSSSSFIPQTMSTPAHDPKRLSALLPGSSSSEIASGMYHSTQRNSSGTLLPPPPMNAAKAKLGSDHLDTLTRTTEGYLVNDNQPADIRSEISSLTARSPTLPTNPMPIIIPPLLQPSTSSSSSAFATPPSSCPDPTRCHSPCIHPANLSPSPAQSSSPSTSAFKTPISSFTDSKPPSPSPTSTRPAPPSPAVSRRGSGLSLKQRTQSRRQSGLAIEVMPSPIDVLDSTPTASAKETPTAAAIPISAPTPTPAPPNSAASAASVVVAAAAATVLTPTPTPAVVADDGPLIIVRDYGFAPTDDRFHGRGPFVPKMNKLSRLNCVLAGRSYESGSEAEGNKAKEKEKQKKKKKKKNINGWSDSDTSDMDVDVGDKRFGGSSGRVLTAENALLDDDEDDGGDGGFPGHAFGGGGVGGKGWASFGFGGINWQTVLGSNFLRDAGARETTMSFPSRMELDRNFGQLDDMEAIDGEEEEEEEVYPFDEGLDLASTPLSPGSYRALYVFEAMGDAEMGLEEGQIVIVTGKGRGDGWAVVHDTREGKEGGHALVPESYLEPVQPDDDNVDG